MCVMRRVRCSDFAPMKKVKELRSMLGVIHTNEQWGVDYNRLCSPYVCSLVYVQGMYGKKRSYAAAVAAPVIQTIRFILTYHTHNITHMCIVFFSSLPISVLPRYLTSSLCVLIACSYINNPAA